MKHYRGGERGVALILALGLMVIIAVVALIVALMAISEQGMTASERRQRSAFEGAQGAVELVMDKLPNPSADSGIMVYTNNGLVIWNGDPADSVPGRRTLKKPSITSPTGAEYNVFAYWRYSLQGAARMVQNTGGILANKGVQANVEVGPYVVPAATAE